jgi:hypothetical protein
VHIRTSPTFRAHPYKSHVYSVLIHTSPTCARCTSTRLTCARCTTTLVPRALMHIHTRSTYTRCTSIQVPRVLGTHPHQYHVCSVHNNTSPTCTHAYPYQTHVYSVHIHTTPTCTWYNLYGYYYQLIFSLTTFDVQNDATTGKNIYLRNTLTFNRSYVQYKFKRKHETDFKNGTVSY